MMLVSLIVSLIVISNRITPIRSGNTGQSQCRDHTVSVYGTGPIALFNLMNQWGLKYSDYRRSLGFDVRMTFNDTASHKALPLALQPPVWYTAAHIYNASKPTPANQMFFPYLVRALVVIFNIVNVKKVNLTLQTLGDIYSGNVTVWDDPRIRLYNPGVDLPSAKIQCVSRVEESETTTGLFTQFLEDVSPEWHTKYGSYYGPAFVGGVCCNSTKWPPGVIQFYAKEVVGVVGIVSSVFNTIGYVTEPSITEYAKSLTIASLMTNDGSHMIEPTPEAQQQVMRNYLSSPDSDLVTNAIGITKNHLSAKNAYPMTSVTYMTLNTTIVNQDCCAAMELLGFIDWVLDKAQDDFQRNQSYVPILPCLAKRIKETMLKNVTCEGRYMYDEYLQSLQPQATPVQPWIIPFSVIGGAFLVVTLVYAYLFYQKRRRADINQWLIPIGRIRFDTSSAIRKGNGDHVSLFRHLPTPKGKDDRGIDNDAASIDSATRKSSLSESSGGDARGAIQQLKDLTIPGELDGFPVSLAKLNLLRWPPINWPSKTKRVMTNLKSCSAHKNLATIMGVFCANDAKQYVVTEFCSQGTLHYVLATCRYRLNDTIRRFLCLDVARAFVYLHDRNLASGRLNSLTCYLDSSWSVKVAEWQNAILSFEEGATRGSLVESMLGVAYKPDELLDEESLIRLMYVDDAILTRWTQGDKTQMVSALKHADEYSFGHLLVEIFSGHLPYSEEAETEDFSYTAHFKEKFHKRTDSLRNPLLPQQTPSVVVQLVEQCLKAEPKMRPSFARIHKLLTEMSVRRLGGSRVVEKGIVDVMMEAMDSYAHTLEEKVEERTGELKMLTKRMRDLLNEVLPPMVAEKLFNDQTVQPESFECVSIYFSDIVGFTSISAQSTPLQVMSLLNDLWLLFDSVIDQYDVYKVDTIGDAYMVCSGLPNRNGMLHCRNICQLAIALLNACGQFKIPHLPEQQLRIRIGVNSGPVTAGVVGSKMPQYCVFGDTVNTSARMESTSIPNRIQISQSTQELLTAHFPNDFSTEYRGEIDVKGKGTMKTYWLLKGGGENENVIAKVL